MTTTMTHTQILPDVDLTNLVGLIRIEAENSADGGRLSEELSAWLAGNRWSGLVKTEVLPTSHGCEVTFLPGEHQSNPTVKLAFHAVPAFPEIRHRLAHWLYELM